MLSEARLPSGRQGGVPTLYRLSVAMASQAWDAKGSRCIARNWHALHRGGAALKGPLM
jgi:hypothetical protein